MLKIKENRFPPSPIIKSILYSTCSLFIGYIDLLFIYLDLSKQNTKHTNITNHLIGTIITLFFLFFIFKSKNWARIIYTLISIIGLVSILPIVCLEITNDIIGAISSIIQIALILVSTLYLFHKESNVWFQNYNKK